MLERYTIDPATGGYGIYLVLWFGGDCTQPPPAGVRPENPVELQSRLEAGLTEDERRKVSVVVVDVSGA